MLLRFPPEVLLSSASSRILNVGEIRTYTTCPIKIFRRAIANCANNVMRAQMGEVHPLKVPRAEYYCFQLPEKNTF